MFYYFQGQFLSFKGNFTKFQDNSRTNGTIFKFQEFARTKVNFKDFSRSVRTLFFWADVISSLFKILFLDCLCFINQEMPFIASTVAWIAKSGVKTLLGAAASPCRHMAGCRSIIQGLNYCGHGINFSLLSTIYFDFVPINFFSKISYKMTISSLFF